MTETQKSSLWDAWEKQEKEKDFKISKNVLEQVCKEAFEIFEQEHHGFIDVGDAGYVIRSLGINPSQKELAELIAEMQEGDKIPFAKLQSKMVPVLMENKIPRHDENKIKRAFQVLDVEKKGFVEPDKLRSLLSTQGEPFSPEEVEEMLAAAVNHESGVIFYEEYSATLATD